jgi:PelA/Pel-15E family pectate lyase
MKPTPFDRVTGMSLLAIRQIRQWSTCSFCILALLAVISPGSRAQSESASLKTEVQRAMRRATTYFRTNVASHGGYVYHYSIDLSRRWGEGEATTDQIWVQPPGTPTVGLAFLRAWHATGEKMYLDAARETAEALVYGQMKSGGWTNCVDFNPQGNRVARYRNGKGQGRNTSSFDDGQTASALLLLIRADQALRFQHSEIHDAAEFGLAAVLKAQYPNGAFPQIWDDDVTPDPPPLQANYPDYDWRTEGRIKQYWHMYTLNDNIAGYITETLLAAHEVYGGDRYLDAVKRLGDFLLLAQMPEPQPGWAQQYNYDMRPIWARKFEPPGVSGDESQEAIETLLRISSVTNDRRYLEPVPPALAYLQRSVLTDGRLARYYELRTNRPLYMERQGKVYSLTYDDSRLPRHYGWKTESRLQELTHRYRTEMSRQTTAVSATVTPTATDVRRVIAALDKQGRWVSTFAGGLHVGQLKLPVGTKYLASSVFSRNLEMLSTYVQQHK